ncbi:MAG: 50S ribosomal protein L25 [Chlorobi bacterium]|nr:50S ribosomal protein L25 [Chlorobiota bacterium]
MAEIVINAEKRELSTKGYLNTLRKNSKVPGVYYTQQEEPLNIAISEYDINRLVFTTEMNVVNLKIDEKEAGVCVLKDVQFDPLTDKVIHFDFHGVTVGQEFELQIPVSLVGQAPGVREGGMLEQFLHKLDIACLPKYIPQQLEIDVSELNLGDSVHVKDLNFENVRIINPAEVIVVTVSKTREAMATDEVEEDAEEAATEPEVIGKGSDDAEDEG